MPMIDNAAPRVSRPIGFNVIGFISSNLGLGVAGRLTVELIRKSGYPCAVVEVDAGGGRQGHDHAFRHLYVSPNEPLPYAINLYQMNPPEIKLTMEKALPWTDPRSGYFNCCVPFWELSVLPPSWIGCYRRMDAILAPTRFVRSPIENEVEGNVCIDYRQRIYRLDRPAPDRAKWNLPATATVFLFSFDVASDMWRKNPLGAMEAFARAFRGSAGAFLVIKLNNCYPGSAFEFVADNLKRVARNMPNVRILDAVLTHREVMALYSSCDVYVSLHRSEGLGLGLMECMYLGKPVIATGYSGNMDFMTHNNSCLVRYGFTDIAPVSIYRAYAEQRPVQWAEPELDDAVFWMRELAGNPGLRNQIGLRAREDIEKYMKSADEGAAFHEVVEYYRIWEKRKTPERRPIAEPRPAFAPHPQDGAGPGQPAADLTRGANGAGRGRGDVSPSTKTFREPGEGIRVLWQNRLDMRMLPGGDATVVHETMKRLDALPVRADLSLEDCPDLQGYGLVHLNNISRTRDTLRQIRNAVAQGRPAVVNSLYEDMDRYLVPSTKTLLLYRRLAETGQRLRPEDFPLVLERFSLPHHPLADPAAQFLGIGNEESQREILEMAAFVLTSGPGESRLIRERFGIGDKTGELWFGFDRRFAQADGASFRSKYGLSDFALCAARIEGRKNQWPLIEIFRDLPDRTLVLIGSFADAQLERSVRAYAPPNVHFLPRVSQEELLSAFGAARVHVLPSWYELPGLVSLEAAAAGCRVVTTSWGTARDYFGDRVFYCEPDNPQTIRKALLEAWDAPEPKELRDFVLERYSWERAARIAAETYSRVLSGRSAKLAGREIHA